jgi:hypothetical protein
LDDLLLNKIFCDMVGSSPFLAKWLGGPLI